MCLIALAHLVSDRFPLVIAANRDEDYARPTREAHHWGDAPDVVGGRDELQGGSWLAVTRGGRFAAVTNLRGALRRTRSRGALVRHFVLSDAPPLAYAERVAGEASEYAGFHLLAGEARGDIAYLTGGDETAAPMLLAPGVHSLSNAPPGEEWPKTAIAAAHLREVLPAAETPDALAAALLAILSTPRGTGRVEEEIFITGERYGTRASTVVIAGAEGMYFVEQNYRSGGAAAGTLWRFALKPLPPSVPRV